MKRHATILLTLLALSGCATHRTVSSQGPAYGHEDLFRQELAASKPVKEWGYVVDGVSFSNDYKRALVVFSTSGSNPSRKKAILDYDSKRGYFGRMYNHDLPHSKPVTIGEARAMVADLSVNLVSK